MFQSHIVKMLIAKHMASGYLDGSCKYAAR